MPGKKYVFNLFELKTLETYFERLGRDFPKTIGFIINTKRCLSFEEWQSLAGSESPDPTPISLSYHYLFPHFCVLTLGPKLHDV